MRIMVLSVLHMDKYIFATPTLALLFALLDRLVAKMCCLLRATGAAASGARCVISSCRNCAPQDVAGQIA